MADITYTNSEMRTANRARLVAIHIERDVDADGQFTGGIVVGVKALVGYHDGTTFSPHRTVSFSARRTLAQAAAFFGAQLLTTLEQKALELAQTQGELPPGTIT
jgi:hypothetical protein